ncbi:tyrosine-type recombinase/integrase [Nitrosovibrio tenuis]|uniref:Phage integrase family protein n=1 Tax=Nitrosovibrio tenuis TaxID=1233 RepID=A0A1H7R3C2_9PROT|nr:tyrosine-type recombinase/integrase [Nitrosovibrio tenuis]SEL54077.1 Phage integrase family protein [Nitrosovibrio tenuis]
MAAANPVTGTTRQMKIKEGRDLYVTDEMLALIYECASPVIQDAIDLAYLTGQRPADVLKMRWDQVKDGSLSVEQGKTKARLQIDIVGELATVIERIRSRGVVGMTLLCDTKGQQLKHSRYFRSQFKLARDRGEKHAAEIGCRIHELPVQRPSRQKCIRHGEHVERQEVVGTYHRVDDCRICAHPRRRESVSSFVVWLCQTGKTEIMAKEV